MCYHFLRISCQHHKTQQHFHPRFRHPSLPLPLYKFRHGRKRMEDKRGLPPLCLGALPPVLFLAVFLVFRLPSPKLDRPPPRLGLVTVLAIFSLIASSIYSDSFSVQNCVFEDSIFESRRLVENGSVKSLSDTDASKASCVIRKVGLLGYQAYVV